MLHSVSARCVGGWRTKDSIRARARRSSYRWRYNTIEIRIARIDISRKYFRNAGCPSGARCASASVAPKTFSTISNSFVSTSLSTNPARALDGCIDHPKCKLPTQKYNSHAVGTRRRALARARAPKRDISKCNTKIVHTHSLSLSLFFWPLIVFTRVHVLIRGLAIASSRRVPNTNISAPRESNYRPINARVANLLCKRKFIAYPRRSPSFVIFPAEFRAFLYARASSAAFERDAQ